MNVDGTDLKVDSGDFAGQISGNATLYQATPGTLVLSGNNTYTGATQVQGTLRVGAGGETGTLGSGGVFHQRRHAGHQPLQRVHGGQRHRRLGLADRRPAPAPRVLTGDNSYTGATTIAARHAADRRRRHQRHAGAAASHQQRHAGLQPHRHVTVANAISGTGALAQAGAAPRSLTAQQLHRRHHHRRRHPAGRRRRHQRHAGHGQHHQQRHAGLQPQRRAHRRQRHHRHGLA